MNTYNKSPVQPVKAPVKPEKSFKYGAVRAAIWKSEHRSRNGEQFETRRVVMDRSYKDAQGAWKNTNSLDLNDIPKAILALERAYEYLLSAPAQGDDGPEVIVEEDVI
jgi:hypothetical protein